MPLSINVGLSRKASKDYQSTGLSINVTAELDQALLAKPDDLQKQIGELYAQAESALQRQADNIGEPQRQPRRGEFERREPHRPSRYDDREQAGNYDRGYNDRRGRGTGSNGGSMIQSQRRAILAAVEDAPPGFQTTSRGY